MTRPSPFAARLPLVLFVLVSTACRPLSDLEERLGAQPLAQTSKIYDVRGQLIATLHAEEDREVVPIEDIPRVVQDAVVAIEDQRFWTHAGVDLKAVLRAAYVNATTGRVTEGGSTITQQYVKNRLLSPERTLGRKVREAVLAWQLEQQVPKEEILGRYLNTVYFGQGAYGIERGAETFFSIPSSELTLPQAALLAGLIAGPERWDPLDHPGLALDRREQVLDRMYELGMITYQDHQWARRQPLGLRPRLGGSRYPAPYFVDYVKHQILTDPRFGETYTQRYNLLFKGGLRIHTTIHLGIQRDAEAAVSSVLTEPGDPYGALTAVDPRTGYIRAMVGGRNYFAPRRADPFAKVNLALGGSTGRQAGSAFKPFALVAALENGIPPWETYPAPSSLLMDEWPCGTPESPWDVENYEGAGYGGSVSVEQGLINSVNVVYAQIIRDVNPRRVVETAHRMGIRSPLRPYCSAVLGANEVNTLEMASAFGTIANEGTHVEPTAIVRIEDSEGEVVFEAEPRTRQALSEAVAGTAARIMQRVITEGTGTAADIDRPAAGKTGTAQEWRDAWFIGFVPQLSAAVWVGYPEGQISMVYPRTRISRVYGGSYPAQIWNAFMTEMAERLPVRDFAEANQEYVTVAVDITRGCVATSLTPEGYVRYIPFVAGTEPTEPCPAEPVDAVVSTEGRVPSVVGLTSEAANEILEEAGYAVEETFEPAAGYAADSVIDQSPAPGTPAEQGSTVLIIVSAP
ncbi:MAG TPA: penicillin-binding protein [Actinomycetota bacterium]|nr:penicillin-binding protein [Actinomycetota bacterium]